MASRFVAIILLALVGSAAAATKNAGNALDFLTAAKTAADGDTINLTGSFTLFNTAIFRQSVTINGNRYTITVDEPSYGFVFTGDHTKTFSVNSLIIDGASIPRGDPMVYISSSSPTAVNLVGPTIAFEAVTIQNCLSTSTNINFGRGAAFEANTGSRVTFEDGLIQNNFAAAGGAVESTGKSYVLICKTRFVGNTGGFNSPDYWVGRASNLAVYYDPTAVGFVGQPPPSGGVNTTSTHPGSGKLVTLAPGGGCPTLAQAFAGTGYAPGRKLHETSRVAINRRMYGTRHRN